MDMQEGRVEALPSAIHLARLLDGCGDGSVVIGLGDGSPAINGRGFSGLSNLKAPSEPTVFDDESGIDIPIQHDTAMDAGMYALREVLMWSLLATSATQLAGFVTTPHP